MGGQTGVDEPVAGRRDWERREPSGMDTDACVLLFCASLHANAHSQHTESRLHHHAECCCTRDDQGKPTVAQLELVDRPVSMMETWSGLGMTRAQPDVPRDSRGWLDRDFKCLMF